MTREKRWEWLLFTCPSVRMGHHVTHSPEQKSIHRCQMSNMLWQPQNVRGHFKKTPECFQIVFKVYVSYFKPPKNSEIAWILIFSNFVSENTGAKQSQMAEWQSQRRELEMGPSGIWSTRPSSPLSFLGTSALINWLLCFRFSLFSNS